MKIRNLGELFATILTVAVLALGVTSCNAKTHKNYVLVPAHQHYVLVPAHTQHYVLVPQHTQHYVLVPAHSTVTTHTSRNGNIVHTVTHADGSVTRHTVLKNGKVLTQHLKH